MIDDATPLRCADCGCPASVRRLWWNTKRNRWWCMWCFYRLRGSDYMQSDSEVSNGYDNTLFEGDDIGG